MLVAFQVIFVSCLSASLSRTANDSATATKEVERLHSELQTAQRQLAAVEEQLADINARSAPPAGLLASSVVPIGIRWTATDKTQRFSWKGTAFGVQGSTVLVTAAHVLEQTTNELRDFIKRDLPAEIVVRLRTGQILKVGNPRYHPKYPAGRSNREAPVSAVNDLPAPPSITLALQSAGELPAEPTISLDRESGDGWGCEHVLQHVLTNVAEWPEASLFGPEEGFSLVGIQSVARDVSVDFGTVCTQMSPFGAEDFEPEYQEQELSSEPRVRGSNPFGRTYGSR